MRSILSLIISLVLAAALCLALMAGGVLEFKDNHVLAKLKPMGEKVFSYVTTALDSLTAVQKDALSTDSRKNSFVPQPTDKAFSVPGHTTDRVSKNMPHTNPQSLIHDKALAFLAVPTEKDGDDIEGRFSEFLTQELGVEETEREKVIRMSFWKNFVTLQQPWRPGEGNAMRLAFAREKELKRAGFAAKGLTLMESGVQEAEARLEEVFHRLSETAPKGERS